MNRTAYLVGHIDVTQSPPVVVAVAVYSSNARQIENNWRKFLPFDITAADGESYEDAIKNLRDWVNTHRGEFGWVLPFTRQGRIG